MNVLDIPVNESAKIVKVGVTGAAAERLRALGFVCGRAVTVLGYSIFKSSVLLSCGAVRLAVRKTIAARIEVQPL